MEPFARLPKRILRDDRLSATAKNLFGWLDAALDKKTGHCEPSIGWLAAKLDRSRRTVEQALTALEAAGYVRVERVSGRRNRYLLLPDPTGAENCAGCAGPTSAENCAGTSAENCAGPADSPSKGFQEQEKEAPLSRERLAQKADPQPSLFARQHHDWLRSALEYFLADAGDDARLQAMRDWYPSLVAGFFILRSWQKESDVGNALAWARHLAKLDVSRAEAQAAFDAAAISPPTDAQGRRLFGRPDYFNHIVAHVQAQRRAAKAKSLARAAAGESGGDADRAWAEASEAEREAIRGELRLRFSGPASFFEAACKQEFLARRGRAGIGAHS